jgi:hypothetical protein
MHLIYNRNDELSILYNSIFVTAYGLEKQSQKFAKDLKLSLLEANNKSGTQIE